MLYAILGGAAALVGLAVAFFVLSRLRLAGIAMQQQLAQSLDEISQLRTAFQTAQQDHDRWAADFHKEIDRARNQLLHETNTRIGSLMRIVGETTQSLVRRPLPFPPIEPKTLDTIGEDGLLRRAESIAILRPLVPYPRWQTDADLYNPDFGYQLRRWIWQYFHDRGEAAIVANWHGGTRLRLFLGNDESAQIFVGGCIEPNEFAFLDRILRPGMTFVDAGANNGIYTVFAAKRVGSEGTVLAFEPSARELERLKFNLELNGLAVQLFPVALADENSQARLTISDREHQGQSTLGDFAYPDIKAEATQTVDVRRLDDVLKESTPQRIDVLKIDVEGAELRLLRGAVRTLERYRPYILMEVSERLLSHQGASRESLLDFLRSFQYRIYGFDPVTGLPFPAAPGVYSDNMIGVPEEKPLPEAAAWPWPVLV